MTWFDVRGSGRRLRQELRRTRARRVLGIVALVLFGIYGFYVAVANAMLATGAIDALANMHPRQMMLYIGRGWTLVPGRIHFKDFRMRFQDHNVQFFLTVDEGVVDVSLFELPRQVFHTTRLRASGIRYWLRHKVTSTEGLEDRLRAYPPIPGVDPTPLFDIGVKSPPMTDEEYNLWTIHMDDVQGTVRELWMLDGRWTGHGTVKGAFRLKPDRELWVGPAHLTLDPGTVRIEPYTVSTDFRVDAAIYVEPFSVRVPKGLGDLEHIFADVDMSGTLQAGLAFLKLYAPRDVHVDGAARRVDAYVKLHQGIVEPGTKITIAPAATRVRTPDVGVQTTLALAAVAEGSKRDSAKAEGHVKLQAHAAGRGELTVAHAKIPLEIGLAEAVATTRNLSVLEPPSLAGLKAEVRRVRASVVDFAPLVASSDLRLESGAVEVTGAVDDEPSRGTRGVGHVVLDDVAFRAGALRVQARGSVKTELAQPAKSEGWKGSLQVDLPLVGVRSGSSSAGSPMKLDATVDLVTHGKDAPKLHMPFRLEGPSGDVLAAVLGDAPWLVQLGSGMLKGSPARASGDVRVSDKEVSVRVPMAKSGSIDAAGGLRLLGSTVRGACLLRSGVLSVGLKVSGDSVSPQIFASEGWLKEQLAAAGAAL